MDTGRLKVALIGDAFAAGQGDYASMAGRIAEERHGGIGLDFTGPGGLAAAHRRIPDLVRSRPHEVVILVGTEDAGATPSLRLWLTLYTQLLRGAMLSGAERIAVVLPPSILKCTPEGEHAELFVEGWTKDARRWVRRVRRDVPKLVSEAQPTEIVEVQRGMVKATYRWERELVGPVLVDADELPDLLAHRADAVWLKPSGYEALSEMIAQKLDGAKG